MRKLILIAAIVVVVLVVATVLVVTNLERIVNSQKGAILARAEAQIGREIGVGDIGVTLRHGLGVRLAGVTIGEDPAFGTEPFVEASDVQVNVKLLPLLRKELQVKNVILRSPVIRIVKNEKGELNAQSLAKPRADARAPERDTTAPSTAAAIPLVVSLASIENGEIEYIDETQGLEVRVRKIETSVRDLDLEKPLTVDLEAALFSDDQNVRVEGTIGPLPLGKTEGEAPVGVPLDVAAEIDPLDLAAVRTALPRLAESLPQNVRIEGPLGIRATAEGKSTDMLFSGTVDGARIEAELPQGMKKAAGVPLVLDTKGRYTPEKIFIETAVVRFASLEVNATGEYTLTKPPAIALDIRSGDVGLSGWDAIIPMAAPYRLAGQAEFTARVEGNVGPGETPSIHGKALVRDGSATVPQAAKTITGIAAQASFTDHRAEIEQASLRIGESRVEGRATIDSFEPLSVSYDVTSPSLALADVAPPQPSAKKPEHLDDLSAKGRLTIDPESKAPSGAGTISSPSGSVANIEYSALGAAYAIEGKTVRLTDVKAKALDGEISGSGVISTGEAATAFDLKLAAKNVDITEVFTAIPGSVHKVLSGKASLDLNVSGSGKEWPDIQKTLKGSGFADLFDGEILEVNLGGMVFDEIGKYVAAANLLPAQLKARYPSIFEQKTTSFKNLKSDFVIESGRLLARNLQLKHDDYRIGAKGSIGFDRSLDVSATFVVSKKLTDDLVRSYQALSYLENAQGEIELPLVIGGALPGVSVRPDADSLRNIVQKGLIDRGLDVLKKNKLENIFPGRKPTPPDTTRGGG